MEHRDDTSWQAHMESGKPRRKQALISGASRGIGSAAARVLAAGGYDLYLTCRHQIRQLQQLKEELEKEFGICCRAVSCNMGDDRQVSRLFEEIEYLDVLVNNAGISYMGLLTDMKPEQWQEVMDVNLNSIFYTCRQAVPLMVRQQSGRIINISSVWGCRGASMEVAYSTAKGGMNSFTKALAKELAPSHISVNALACGVIDTEMNRMLDEAERELLKEEIPACRFGTPEEAADMILQLVEAPEYLTGQIICLDGGWQV